MDAEAWDREALTFDDAPDHGLRASPVRAAWRDLLMSVLPPPPARIADLGCGTGTLARLLTDEGYSVDGVDFSPGMVARARAKVPEGRFVVADAARPPLDASAYDGVLARHVLWAMEQPADALTRWLALLRPRGTVVLIEGRWSTGAGLTAAQTGFLLQDCLDVRITPLPDARYWGREITDERYLAVAHKPGPTRSAGAEEESVVPLRPPLRGVRAPGA